MTSIQRRAPSGSSPVYQIDFTAVASGKRIASSKRRVRWRFGFTNQSALAAGETGTECRGEEHDITVIWSISSGKRHVLADGAEVHYSISWDTTLEFSWQMKNHHVIKIVAYSSPPLTTAPGFRQYDLLVDGLSYFSMPKVYRLGLNPSSGRANEADTFALATSSRVSGGYNNYSVGPGSTTRTKSGDIAELEAPHSHDEEEAYLKEAIKLSLEEKKEESAPKPAKNPEAKPAKEENLLLDFFSDPEPAPAAPAVTHNFAAPTSAPTGDPFAGWFDAPVPVTAPPTDPFAATSTDYGFGTALKNDPSDQSMMYSQPSVFQHGATPMYAQPAPAINAPIAPVPVPFSMLDPVASAGVRTDINYMHQNFAKTDSIDLVLKKEPNRSNPFDFSAPGLAPTLSENRSVGSTGRTEKAEIMRTLAPAPGSLVIAANQSGNWDSHGVQQTQGGYGGQQQYSQFQQPQQAQQKYQNGLQHQQPNGQQLNGMFQHSNQGQQQYGQFQQSQKGLQQYGQLQQGQQQYGQSQQGQQQYGQFQQSQQGHQLNGQSQQGQFQQHQQDYGQQVLHGHSQQRPQGYGYHPQF